MFLITFSGTLCHSLIAVSLFGSWTSWPSYGVSHITIPEFWWMCWDLIKAVRLHEEGVFCLGRCLQSIWGLVIWLFSSEPVVSEWAGPPSLILCLAAAPRPPWPRYPVPQHLLFVCLSFGIAFAHHFKCTSYSSLKQLLEDGELCSDSFLSPHLALCRLAGVFHTRPVFAVASLKCCSPGLASVIAQS